ncbi:hypothetical protein M569_17124 [Genlisea aurea]|uniref:Myb/SANT-like domain-containing protein n=1 Tax=Genlisea aurea TaxID=192259 RepID=S8D4S6_9LAMI|nr:hypothetical protein M569_17124 [Genlisea aurea]
MEVNDTIGKGKGVYKHLRWVKKYNLKARLGQEIQGGKSGVGFNSVTKMVTATDDLWNEIEKEFSERKKMKMKRWPYFESWRAIFDKDRASGAQQHIERNGKFQNEIVIL